MNKQPFIERGSTQAGVSLIEVLVATLLTATVAAGILALFVSGRELAGVLDNRTQAINYVQETLESLKNAVSTDITRSSSLNAGIFDVSSGMLLPGGSRVYTVTDIDLDGDLVTDAKKVTVAITWTELE